MVVVYGIVTEFYIISYLKQNLVDVKVLINVFNLTVLWQTEGIGIWGEILAVDSKYLLYHSKSFVV